MPSREQLALRKTAAFERLNGTLAALSERLGIDTEAVGSAQVKDPDLAAVVHIEQMADAVDAIAGAIPEKAKAKPPANAVKKDA